MLPPCQLNKLKHSNGTKGRSIPIQSIKISNGTRSLAKRDISYNQIKQFTVGIWFKLSCSPPVNTVPHTRQHSITQPSTQYHTAVNTVPHSRQHSTTQPSTQYHTAVRSRLCEERGGAQCSVWKPLCLHLYSTLPVLFCQTEKEMNLSLTT